MRQGQGMLIEISGDQYIGEWENDMKTGKGVELLGDGVIYEGNFLDEEFHGYGKMTWENGDIYEG